MNKIIVSLTSYPKRIHIVAKVVKSLWKQSVPADEIILYLSNTEFPQRERELPTELAEMIGKKGFQIKWVEGNIRSHKKYFYIFQDKPDDIVITVDDDVFYSETLIEELFFSYKKFPQAISARMTRIVLKDGDNIAEYKDWEICVDKYANMPRMDLCAIGHAGVLYPPSCGNIRWFDLKNIKSLADSQDDLWLKYNEIIDQIPVVYVKPAKIDKPIDEAEETALWTMNKQNGNDTSIVKLSMWVKNNYFEDWEKWVVQLMQKKEYFLLKWEDSIEAFKKLLDELKNSPIYLYGAGKKAKNILNIMKECDLLDRLEGIIVSDKYGNPDSLDGKEIKCIDEIDNAKLFTVIYGVGNTYKKEVESLLKRYNCICLDFNIG